MNITIHAHKDCTSLFKTNLKTGVIENNQKIRRSDCTCPCTYEQIPNGTCVTCGHKKMPLKTNDTFFIEIIEIN